MVEQTVDNEPRVQAVVNPAGTNPRIGGNHIWPDVLGAKNRASESFIRSTDRQSIAWQTGEPHPAGPRGDDADDPLTGDADESRGA